MKKIMFNDKYGLTQSVLEGRKTMTRRMANAWERQDGTLSGWMPGAYKVGEEVAVAQSYETLANSGTRQLELMMETSSTFKNKYCGAGWNNKMFVKADLMPHRIRITEIKVERLKDISENDCLKEGIKKIPHPFVKDAANVYTCHGIDGFYTHPKDCFADLIDKVSGKGTWERNPWVFAYGFELIKKNNIF